MALNFCLGKIRKLCSSYAEFVWLTSEIVASCLKEFNWYLFLIKSWSFILAKCSAERRLIIQSLHILTVHQTESICHCLPFLIFSLLFRCFISTLFNFQHLLGDNQHDVESFLIVGTVSQQPFNFFSCSHCSSSKLCCYCPLFVQLTFTGLWERIRVSWLFFSSCINSWSKTFLGWQNTVYTVSHSPDQTARTVV